ncbi:MAG: enoyl-CoA hydratase/isomerase family protein [Sporichthyaceae bacterium]
MTDTMVVDRADGVVTVTMNRPKRRNGINQEMVEGLIRALEEVAGRHTDRVLILTGAGSAFCSGMDLAEPALPDEFTFMRRTSHLCRTLYELPIPTIAAVRGGAIGFGANLALCADLVLAADDAVFGEVFAALGIGMDGGGSWLLPRLIGPQQAKELAFFGARVSGAEAAAMGLANRAVPADELDALVAEWATRLADGPRRALGLIKHQLNSAYGQAFGPAAEAEAIAQANSFKSPEAKVGIKAFMDKRAPNFRSIDD